MTPSDVKAGLRNRVLYIREHHPNLDDFDIAQNIARQILSECFGEAWHSRHADVETGTHPFFQTDDHPTRPGVDGDLRVIHLAEMILNLQHEDGVKKTIEMIGSGDIEGGYAELELAKLLFANGVKFQFVSPHGNSGDDYDLLVDFSQGPACAETKCKIETTGMTKSAVLTRLKAASKQLPKNQPGLIFMRVPQSWYDPEDETKLSGFLKVCVDDFFRNSQRVVSVKFHAQVFIDDGQNVFQSLRLAEFSNPNHRFDKSVSWSCFREMEQIGDIWLNLMEECSKKH